MVLMAIYIQKRNSYIGNTKYMGKCKKYFYLFKRVL